MYSSSYLQIITIQFNYTSPTLSSKFERSSFISNISQQNYYSHKSSSTDNCLPKASCARYIPPHKKARYERRPHLRTFLANHLLRNPYFINTPPPSLHATLPLVKPYSAHHILTFTSTLFISRICIIQLADNSLNDINSRIINSQDERNDFSAEQQLCNVTTWRISWWTWRR
jgi:hypothetical protein